MKDYSKIEAFVLGKLKMGLPKNLYYHGMHHTLDVLQSATLIGREEKLTEEELLLVKVAVLFHDSGFIEVYKNHEEVGCRMAKTELPNFGFTNDEIDMICGMIMATKIPQVVTNKLEAVIADADLEYLGTDRFWEIGRSLYEEFKIYLNVDSERQWNIIQMNFLKSHSYHTDFCKKNREAQKQVYLKEVIALVEKDNV